MEIDLFAGVAVSDLSRAVDWFDRFFGDVESFEPNDTERVWTVAEHLRTLRPARRELRLTYPYRSGVHV
ncbi:MAG: hypothetical protein L0I76_12030 [Pseudonocardia sp.]|nr:hypothetical protein [Pseudonocardia sp.]